jgi:Tfp pilus assembly protein PilN
MINLLPFFYKEELKKLYFYKVIANLLLVLFFAGIEFLILSLSLYFYLESKLYEFNIMTSIKESELQKSDLGEIKNKISELNQILDDLNNFNKEQVKILPLFKKIFDTLPEGVKLDSLSWQKDSGNVAFSGFAPTREILFQLKTNLENVPEFDQVVFPPQNWVKATNVDFQVVFKIKNESNK